MAGLSAHLEPHIRLFSGALVEGPLLAIQQLSVAERRLDFPSFYTKPIMGGMMTFTHMGAMMGQGPDQREWMQLFNDDKMNRHMIMGMTPLQAIGLNTEADPQLVKDIVAKGGDLDKVDKVPKALLALASIGAALGVKPLVGMKQMLGMFNLKATALHRAALVGNIEMVRELVAAGARTDVRDKGGLTPLERAAKGLPGNIIGAPPPLEGTPTLQALKAILEPKVQLV